MKTIIKKTYINCSLKELFDFHTNSSNIKKITPPTIAVELLDADTKAYEGKVLNIKIFVHSVGYTW